MTLASHWPTFLDGAVVLGVLGCIAKAADLILDSHQQAQFQRFMDRVTLRLIDLNVIKWYPRLRNPALNIPIFLFIVGTEWLIIAKLGRNPKITENLKTLHASGWQPYAQLACFQFLIYLGIVNWLARIRRAWLFCVSTLLPGISAIPFIIISFLAMVGWMVFVSTAFKDNPTLSSPATFLAVLFGVFGLFAIAVLWLYLSGIIFCLGAIVFGLWLFVGFLRGLFWRIATYAKGAWAAAWIVVTVILAMADVYMKAKGS
ncbi:MAG: hypothetical protein ABSG65_07240 [Bryobacteraceae bacterium]|jgi:hypothetical protein